MVPIWFGHKDWTKMFKTYPMLDNWSQGSFTKDELIKDLESNCSLIGEKSEDTMAANRLIISGIDLKETNNYECIELPRAYSKQSLPVKW